MFLIESYLSNKPKQCILTSIFVSFISRLQCTTMQLGLSFYGDGSTMVEQKVLEKIAKHLLPIHNVVKIKNRIRGFQKVREGETNPIYELAQATKNVRANGGKGKRKNASKTLDLTLNASTTGNAKMGGSWRIEESHWLVWYYKTYGLDNFVKEYAKKFSSRKKKSIQRHFQSKRFKKILATVDVFNLPGFRQVKLPDNGCGNFLYDDSKLSFIKTTHVQTVVNASANAAAAQASAASEASQVNQAKQANLATQAALAKKNQQNSSSSSSSSSTSTTTSSSSSSSSLSLPPSSTSQVKSSGKMQSITENDAANVTNTASAMHSLQSVSKNGNEKNVHSTQSTGIDTGTIHAALDLYILDNKSEPHSRKSVTGSLLMNNLAVIPIQPFQPFSNNSRSMNDDDDDEDEEEDSNNAMNNDMNNAMNNDMNNDMSEKSNWSLRFDARSPKKKRGRSNSIDAANLDFTQEMYAMGTNYQPMLEVGAASPRRHLVLSDDSRAVISGNIQVSEFEMMFICSSFFFSIC